MKALSIRTDSFTDSVIRRMTRISDQYGAINLSQGFPDFEPPSNHRPISGGGERRTTSVRTYLGCTKFQRGTCKEAGAFFGNEH